MFDMSFHQIFLRTSFVDRNQIEFRMIVILFKQIFLNKSTKHSTIPI